MDTAPLTITPSGPLKLPNELIFKIVAAYLENNSIASIVDFKPAEHPDSAHQSTKQRQEFEELLTILQVNSVTRHYVLSSAIRFVTVRPFHSFALCNSYTCSGIKKLCHDVKAGQRRAHCFLTHLPLSTVKAFRRFDVVVECVTRSSAEQQLQGLLTILNGQEDIMSFVLHCKVDIVALFYPSPSLAENWQRIIEPFERLRRVGRVDVAFY